METVLVKHLSNDPKECKYYINIYKMAFRCPLKIAIQKISERTGEMTFEDKLFNSYQEFKQYHQSLPDSHHYEVITGKQCLYFDFDGKTCVSEQNFAEFCEVVVSTLANMKIGIFIFSSLGFEKYSYHILVRGIYLENHTECEFLAKRIISQLNPNNELRKSFDATIYTSRRNFRLLGSRKINSTRVKKFHENIFNSEGFVPPDDILRLSFVTNVEGCVKYDCQIPVFDIGDSGAKSITEWNADDVNRVHAFLEENYKDVFEITGYKDNLMLLKRKKAAHCNICDRIHNAENAYVCRVGKKLYFACRRAENGKRELIDDDFTITINFKDDEVEKKQEDVSDKAKKKIIDKINKLYCF